MNNKSKKYFCLFIFFIIIIGSIGANKNKVYSKYDEQIKPKEIYLTFDDGPGTKTTNQVLDILKENNIKATFFIVGKQIEGREDILKRIVKEGHSLGLHTYTHNFKTIYRNNKTFIDEMLKCQEKIYKVTGVKTNIIRFPGGSCKRLNRGLKEEIEKNNFKIYDWNMALSDGINYRIPASKLYREGTKNKRHLSKIILLMHCDSVNKNTCIALPDIIKFYKELGYEFKAINKDTPEFIFPYKNK